MATTLAWTVAAGAGAAAMRPRIVAVHAADSAMRSSGVAIALNALTVALGFLALTLSAFRGVADMGLLISLTMVTSAFAALTILPVLFILLQPKAFRVNEATGTSSE